MGLPAVVIGGGWAGLAAAFEISATGSPVILLEGSRRLGGRARSVRLEDRDVDNGQHLLVGACGAVLEVLRCVGIEESEAFQRQPFGLYLRDLGGRRVHFQAPKSLPAPLHLGAALLGCRGLPLATRLRALWRARSLLEVDPAALAGITVRDWLAKTLQPDSLRTWLWEPLCLAALNTSPAEASAALMARLLREVMAGHRAGSDLLLPKLNLSTLFVDPVAGRIKAAGGSLELRAPVIAIDVRQGAVTAVRTRQGRIACDRVVLATGPGAARRLLESAGAQQAAARIAMLEERPITTVYLQYPHPVRLEAPFVGSVGTRIQWLFDRALPGQDGLIAAVISADVASRDDGSLGVGEQAAREVAQLYPHWPRPVGIRAVRERRATFAATPASDGLRQPPDTGIEGLWVVGDYTDTGLPGTLEGAVRSGLQSARALLSCATNRRGVDARIQTLDSAIS